MFCPNGIPETLNKESTAERNNKVPHLLFLSNLLESKGVLVLLDALKLLSDKGYSFVCDFVGGKTAEIDAARFKREVEQRGLNKLAIYDGKSSEKKRNNTLNRQIYSCSPLIMSVFPWSIWKLWNINYLLYLPMKEEYQAS